VNLSKCFKILLLVSLGVFLGCVKQNHQPFTSIVATYPNGQKKVVEIRTNVDSASHVIRREIYGIKGNLLSVEDIASQTLTEYRYYKNDRKMSVQVLHDNKPDGTWKRWYANGVLAAENNYRNGKSQGTWKYWDSEGKLTRQLEYWEGQLRWEKTYK